MFTPHSPSDKGHSSSTVSLRKMSTFWATTCCGLTGFSIEASVLLVVSFSSVVRPCVTANGTKSCNSRLVCVYLLSEGWYKH